MLNYIKLSLERKSREEFKVCEEIFMSRIGAGECEHMEWYGVDKKGNVAVFCSGGEGNLPEFICESEERADDLIEYFDKMKKTTSSMLMFPQTKVGRAEQVARDFSDKGLYYFDADDGTKLGVCTLHEYYNIFPRLNSWDFS